MANIISPILIDDSIKYIHWMIWWLYDQQWIIIRCWITRTLGINGSLKSLKSTGTCVVAFTAVCFDQNLVTFRVMAYMLTHCGLVTPYSDVTRPQLYYCINIYSGNGLLHDDTTPLPDPMLTYHQMYSVAFTCQQVLMNWIRHMCSEFTLLRLLPHLLGASGLMLKRGSTCSRWKPPGADPWFEVRGGADGGVRGGYARCAPSKSALGHNSSTVAPGVNPCHLSQHDITVWITPSLFSYKVLIMENGNTFHPMNELFPYRESLVGVTSTLWCFYE